MKPNVYVQNSNNKRPNFILTGLIKYEEGDYGGNFANYFPFTLSAETDFDIRVVRDVNSDSPGIRLYIYAGGSWYYVGLTEVIMEPQAT